MFVRSTKRKDKHVLIMGKSKFCYVCKLHLYKGKPQPIIRHHICYFPEIVCFVHLICHERIHDPNNPLTEFIKYGDGDSFIFYSKRFKKNKKGKINENLVD